MNAIVAIFIRYLPYLIQAAQALPQITTFIAEVHAIFARTKIWTDAEEAEFDAQTAAMRSDPYWIVKD